MDRQKKNMGAVAFLPLIVFLVCYVGCGITFTLLGADEPFGKFPRHVALLAGCAVALLLNRGIGVQDKLNIMTTSMGNSGVMMIVLIYLPQKRQDKKDAAMRNSIEIGDKVTTIGGIVGIVCAIADKDDTLVIETGSDRTKIRFRRSAISSVEKLDTGKDSKSAPVKK